MEQNMIATCAHVLYQATNITVYIQTAEGWHAISIDDDQVTIHQKYTYNVGKLNQDNLAYITLKTALNLTTTVGRVDIVESNYDYKEVVKVYIVGCVEHYGAVLANGELVTTWVVNRFEAELDGKFFLLMTLVIKTSSQYPAYMNKHYIGGAVISQKTGKFLGFVSGVDHATHLIPINPYMAYFKKQQPLLSKILGICRRT